MFKNVTIKIKLIILAIIPIVALLFLSSFIILEQKGKFDEYHQLNDLVDLSIHISNTVHNIQKERGLTAGFISSNGTNFKEALETQRIKTSKELDKIISYIKM